jgi:ATP-binding cassette subfamily B protein
LKTFNRLLRFLDPYRKGVAVSFLLASGAMAMTVLIPLLTGQAINSIRSGSRHTLTLWVVGIVVAGLGRVILSVYRRLIAGRVSLGVELDLRNRLYEHLQRLELSFFDRQQTGQLMSRVTVDLQSVRL